MTTPAPTPGAHAGLPATAGKAGKGGEERTALASEPKFWWDDHGERIAMLESQLAALADIVEKLCKDLGVHYPPGE